MSKNKCKCGHYVNNHMPKGYEDKGCCVIYRKDGKLKMCSCLTDGENYGN